MTKLFGFDCIDNFKRPYFSVSIRDFWRRWHLSLSSWLRDYVYIPLGGSRCAKWKIYRNTLVTFILCGIWHGSSLHYAVWGAYHGVLNSLSSRKKDFPIYQRVFRHAMTLLFVLFGWLLFRAESLSYAVNFIRLIVTSFSLSYSAVSAAILPFTGDNNALAYGLSLFGMIAVLFLKELLDEKTEKSGKQGVNCQFVWTGIYLFLVILFGATGSSNFLYANF